MKILLKNISKVFGTNIANKDVTLEINEGEVLALLGENGAGKSTLMKILYGYQNPSAGEILIDGNVQIISNPKKAMELGIGMVFQHFNLIPALSVLENLLLAHPACSQILKQAKNIERVQKNLKALAPNLSLSQKVSELSVGNRQLLEIAKVLNLDAKVIILDEPTSVLTPQETERLYVLIKEIRDRGCTVILITHKFEDVIECADRTAIMRAGMLVDTFNNENLKINDIASKMMGGEEIPAPAKIDHEISSTPRLFVHELEVESDGMKLNKIQFEAYGGEIIGIAGVSGNGQTLLANSLAGIEATQSGHISFDGIPIHTSVGSKPVHFPLSYIPERPLDNAVAGAMNLWVNLNLKKILQLPFWLKKQNEAEVLAKMEEFDVRPRIPNNLAKSLSGGNLQKLVAARELSAPADFVIACYPTMGLDIKATAFLYESLFEYAKKGGVVLWISEDLDDLLQFSHSIHVLYHGEIIGSQKRGNFDKTQLGKWMMGVKE